MALRASIDLGTNTCLLLIAECDEKGRVAQVIDDRATIVRLGEGVDKTRRLSNAAVERTLECLKGYAEVCIKSGVEPCTVIAVGTSSSRDADNGKDFYALVERETGFRFRILSGDDEAKYTFLGGLPPGVDPARAAIIDIGGGSTEFIVQGSAQETAQVSVGDSVTREASDSSPGISLDIGSVRFTERYLKSNPVTDSEFWSCQEAIDAEVSRAIPWREKNSAIENLIAVAGTATTLAAWHLELRQFDPKRIDACVLTRGDVHRQVEELKWRTHEERGQLPGIERGREDVLLAGALVLWRSMELLGFPEVRISTRGLRFGVFAIELFG
jgi:exopolyphosphatase/guanosine-5'-triphosphate,3'-diphosphate pyrophosphatase